MKLSELAKQYRQSARLCRSRARELLPDLERGHISETERLMLRRRIGMLSAMARDAAATANYLEYYYERREVYVGKQKMGTGNGVSGSAEVYQAGRFL